MAIPCSFAYLIPFCFFIITNVPIPPISEKITPINPNVIKTIYLAAKSSSAPLFVVAFPRESPKPKKMTRPVINKTKPIPKKSPNKIFNGFHFFIYLLPYTNIFTNSLYNSFSAGINSSDKQYSTMLLANCFTSV